MKKYNVAIVGATGAVGEALISILEERDFPVNELFPLASERSAGSKITFRGKSITVLNLADFDFSRAGNWSVFRRWQHLRNVCAKSGCSRVYRH
jgi:aspartate-semialdehyde dehydrogenase